MDVGAIRGKVELDLAPLRAADSQAVAETKAATDKMAESLNLEATIETARPFAALK